jgi:putative ABC transport system substrate-binding protein
MSVRPADNMTGICARTTELDLNRLDLLSQILPNEKQFGVLINKRRPDYTTQKADLQTEAARLTLSNLNFAEIDPDSATTSVKNQIKDAFAYWAGQTPPYIGALIAADSLFNNHRKDIIDAAKDKKIAAVYQWREFVEEGGLISYGPNLAVGYTLAGIYAGYLLDASVRPIDLGLKIPPILLAQADSIIVD